MRVAMLKKSLSDKFRNSQQITAISIILMIAVVGTIVLTGSHAATPYVSSTANTGTLASGAVSQTCSGASNGNCVVFNGSTGTGGGGTGTSPACTTTTRYTTTAAAASAVAAAPAGTAICMAPGSYGSITLTGTHTANVTFEPDPSLDPNGAGKVTFSSIKINASNTTVHNFYSTGGIQIGTGTSGTGSNNVIDHNDVSSNGYGVSVYGNQNGQSFTTLASNITISGNRIHDTSSTGEGDALRLQGYSNVTITGNELYNIKECAGDGCHTDTLQSYEAQNPTSGLTLTKNYIHDTGSAQGFPFLHDGDLTNVTIGDNLSLRMKSSNQVTGIWDDTNINGLVITNNTYEGTSGSHVQSDGTSKTSPTVTVNHNVFDSFSVQTGESGLPYTFTTPEDYDIFGSSNGVTLGPHTTRGTPSFKCGSSCTSSSFTCADTACSNLSKAGDDYELASNPNGIGIDWSPANQHYGPTQ